MSSQIIICEQRFDIGHRVVTYESTDGYSAYLRHHSKNPEALYPSHPAPGLAKRRQRYRDRRLLSGSNNLSALRQVVRQIVVHLDGCFDARMCFDVLHNQRGLSVHFMIDNDGTIYQTLDLAACAFHAGGVNEISVGIELQNRGDAARFPDYYKARNQPARETVTCRVHGFQFLAYNFTAAQNEAMVRLCRALTRILDVPLHSPQTPAGAPHWSTISLPRQFAGILGHYHVNRRKWDPGPWDFRRLIERIGTRVTFPLSPISQQADAPPLAKQTARYHRASERTVAAYFPVGPLGRSRLWHGGVHLSGDRGQPVYAVLPGTIVAGRMTKPCSVGDCNFVLIRHALPGGSTAFSLYYHLEGRAAAWQTTPPSWLANAPTVAEQLRDGAIALLNIPVTAGEKLGNMGEAGPRSHRQPQLHFAIFAVRDVTERLAAGDWNIINGSRTSRLCRNPELIAQIDRPHGGKPRDGSLSRQELRRFFFSDPQRSALHRLAVRHRSEWTPGDWQGQLARAPDFAELSQPERQRLIARQITPTLWWTRQVAAHAGLPEDGYVYSYHPIGFLDWYDDVLRRRLQQPSQGIGRATDWTGQQAPSYLTVDDELSDAMADEEDLLADPDADKLELEDLVQGYQ